MGPPRARISASVGTAIMFVGLTFTCDPLSGDLFVDPQPLLLEGAHMVCDARDIGSAPTNNASAARLSTCNPQAECASRRVPARKAGRDAIPIRQPP